MILSEYPSESLYRGSSNSTATAPSTVTSSIVPFAPPPVISATFQGLIFTLSFAFLICPLSSMNHAASPANAVIGICRTIKKTDQNLNIFLFAKRPTSSFIINHIVKLLSIQLHFSEY